MNQKTNGHEPATARPEVPLDEYGEQYFRRYNYADRPLSRFSMYWFARRYYAALIRRYAPPGEGALLEMGCGLGHLLGLLQDEYRCVGIDLAEYSIVETRRNAPRAQALVQSADDLSRFASEEFSVVVALHLLEHLPEPANTIGQVYRVLRPGGMFMFATPNPVYALRCLKDPTTDAIGKDPTHINVQPPTRWREWVTAHGFRILLHFGDGLWDVPYLPRIPTGVQFAIFGFPALVQVLTQTAFNPLALGVNQVMIARKPREAPR